MNPFITVLVAAIVAVGCSNAVAETVEERAARIKAAAEALQQAEEQDESPEALKARIKELEEENRRLRIELGQLRGANTKVDGEGGNPVTPAGDKQSPVFTSFTKMLNGIPENAMPEPKDRDDQSKWSAIHKKQVARILAVSFKTRRN